MFLRSKLLLLRWWRLFLRSRLLLLLWSRLLLLWWRLFLRSRLLLLLWRLWSRTRLLLLLLPRLPLAALGALRPHAPVEPRPIVGAQRPQHRAVRLLQQISAASFHAQAAQFALGEEGLQPLQHPFASELVDWRPGLKVVEVPPVALLVRALMQALQPALRLREKALGVVVSDRLC